MARYDGSIRIDTRIDSKGFNSGISNMVKSAKGLAIAVGLALSVASIVAFGRASVAAASDMTNAYIGLKSVVDGSGRSFQQAKAFIDDYIKDGLVPAGDAVTAYKNLLMRGYSTEQIEQTMIALKNSAAFGRQSSLTLGQAVKSASEGLKNENSILVDNAGVTKNVSMMWKDYAESIGVGVQSLTKQQKIQAEVNGIMEETRFQMNDASKLAATYSGQTSALSTAVTRLKVAFGNVFIPVLTKIIPYIRAVVDALTSLFEKLATIMSIFFDVSIDASMTNQALDGMADSSVDAADGQEQLADSTKKATKAAKGALAAFDQLNVLMTPDDEKSPVSDVPIEMPPLDTTETDTSLDALKEKVLGFKEELLRMLAPSFAAFERLKKAVQPLADEIKKGLGWVWTNILVPFGEWAISSFLPVFIDLLAASFRLLSAVLEPLKPLLLAFWEDILKPMAEFMGGFLVDRMNEMVTHLNSLAVWLEQNPDILGTFLENMGRSLRGFTDTVKNFVTDTRDRLFGMFSSGLETIRTEGFLGVFKAIANGVIDLMNGVVAAVFAGVNAINTAFSKINGTIPDWVPGFGGQSISLGFFPGSLTPPRIPRLAQGAVIPPGSEFLAILGDQKSGTNIEAPEGLIRQIIQEEMSVIRAEFTINFSGSMASLVRELKPAIDNENVRMGRNLIRSGVKLT